MMGKSIRLHPKHGLNPTVPICFYCQKEKGEVALLGAAYKGEAPMHMVLDLVPCEKCKEKIGDGVILLEKHDREAKPTGRFIVLRRESWSRYFNIPTPQKMAYADRETFDMLVKGLP